MNDHSTSQPVPILEEYLASSDETASADIIVRLVDVRVDPLIKAIIRRKLHVSLGSADERHENEHARDLVSESRTLIIDKLDKLRSGKGNAIGDFDAYVRRVAANVCNKHLRDKYPHRLRLKNQLRYLFTHNAGLTSRRSDDGEWICCLRARADQQQDPGLLGIETLDDLITRRFETRDVSAGQMDLADVVSAIMTAAGGPLRFTDLLACVYKLLRIEEPREQVDDTGVLLFLSAQEHSAAGMLEGAEALGAIWAEIKLLPLRHRLALVLSLKSSDGESPITSLPAARVATVRQIAEVLEIEPTQFARIWNELPWGDREIANHLNMTRQQVINLRHWARVTLKRRLVRADRD